MNIIWQKMVPELYVSNFSVSLEFYTNVLGFRVLYTRYDPEFVYLEQEALQLMLLQTGKIWLGEPLEPPYGRGVNLQMEVTDVQPIYERLVEHGVTMQRELKDVWRETGEVQTGSREFYVQDPDGYLLRFCQPLGDKPLA